MNCPKCGSANVSVQMVTENKLKQKHHGIVYWLLFGWFFDLMLWVFLTIPRLLIAIFKPKKQKMISRHKTMCVCQGCGYSWEAPKTAVK